jgi:digeranylgeranylglycerophospholipid reductase
LKTSEQTVDVFVAGGGPGGLSAGEAAARAGCRVLIAEQNAEIGSPTRTSGGTFVSEMKALGVPAELYHVFNRCRFVSPNNQAIIDYDRPNLCGIDVRRVFQHLAERAADAGASIRTATQVIEPLTTADAVTGARMKSRSKEYIVRSRVVVDATGYRAALVKKANVHDGFERFGVGAEYDLYAPHYDEMEAVLIVGSQVAPCGYAWFLPYGRHRVRAGVGVIHRDSTADPNEYLDTLMERAQDFGVNVTGAQPLEYHYGLIPSDGVSEAYVADGIVAVGDAAGQASCLVGEGIRWAMKAGLMAGTLAAECVQADDVSKQALSRYHRQWTAAFGRSLRIAHEINKRIARWTDEQWDRRTDLLKAFTPDQFDQAIQSNFTGAWTAKLVWSHPELVRQGFRHVATRLGIIS